LEIIEQLAERVQRQEEEIARLTDEIAVLQGEKKRLKFKPSKLDEEATKDLSKGGKPRHGKRPGSEKKSKTAQRQIHEDQVIAPCEEVPAGSRFRGYRDFVVQDLVIRAYNVRYRLERWETPDGRTLIGRLPAALEQRHFGPVLLVSYIV
jgi:hypothetical protein